MKNILYYETGSGFGGSAVSLYRLVKYLDKALFKPYVLVHGIGPRIEEIKEMGVNVDWLKLYHPIPAFNGTSPGFLTSILRNFSFYANFCVNTVLNTFIIYKTIKINNIDLVHLNNGIFENFPALIAAKLCCIPCVSHIRGTEPLTKIERIFGRWLAKIITLNSEMNDLYRSVFGAEKSCIVFNGVDLDSFEKPDQTKLRKVYQVPENYILIGTVTRLVSGKGIPEFLKTASEVIKVNKKITFFVIGDDPLLNHSFEKGLRQLCMDLGLNKYVIFTGWRDDVIDLMSGLDLVVQFSTFPEGMSLTPIEAMALNKPIITSDVPGYTDTAEDGVTGFIVPSGDIDTLSRRILELTMNRDLRIAMGNNGRRRVGAEFDVRKTAKKVQEIYKAVLGN